MKNIIIAIDGINNSAANLFAATSIKSVIWREINISIPDGSPMSQCVMSQFFFVFTNEDKPFKSINRRMWDRVCLSVGIKYFRWHDLRHT